MVFEKMSNKAQKVIDFTIVDVPSFFDQIDWLTAVSTVHDDLLTREKPIPEAPLVQVDAVILNTVNPNTLETVQTESHFELL